MAITRVDDGFRYTFSDGRVGAPDENLRCLKDAVTISGSGTWPRVAVRETDTRFASGGIMLTGRLMEPPESGSTTPLVVFAHGSEDSPWIEYARDPYQMVGRGISVFVYDKRGTGQSEGTYSQNFPELADDLVAATHEARRLADGRYGRVGLIGLSQGGWIAPLAAKDAKADFIGIGYGLVTNILEEDAAQVQLELRDAGFGPDVLEKARKVTDVTARLAVSNYQDGLVELAEMQEEYGTEAWFAQIKGGFSGVLINMSVEDLRENGVPMFDRLRIDWTLDPVEILSAVDVPQYWALAGEDREAPITTTLQRLLLLRRSGQDIRVHVFPDTDHGMWEFHTLPDGSRNYTQVTNGFYDLMADWARGDTSGAYGHATIAQ